MNFLFCDRKMQSLFLYFIKNGIMYISFAIYFLPLQAPVTVHAYVPSNGICRGFAFKYGKFLLPPRFLTALSVPKVPTRVQ